jgi:hypothetical protein
LGQRRFRSCCRGIIVVSALVGFQHLFLFAMAQVTLARRMAVPVVAIVLDTPVDVCLQRVGARR